MPATQDLVPHVGAKIDLALGYQRDGKASPNYVDPEALKMDPHFSGEKTSLGAGSGTAEPIAAILIALAHFSYARCKIGCNQSSGDAHYLQ